MRHLNSFIHSGRCVFGTVFLLIVAVRWIAADALIPETPYFDKYVSLGQDFFDSTAREPFTSSPIYSAFLGVLLRGVSGSVPLARIIHLIMGGIAILLLTRAACLLWDYPTGLLTGSLAAVTAPLLIYDSDLVTTGLETLITAVLILSLIRSSASPGSVSWFLPGVWLGLLAGIRPNALLLVPCLSIGAWIISRRGWRLPGVDEIRLSSQKKAWLSVGFAVMGAACAVLPISAMNFYRCGEWIPVTGSGGAVLYSSNNYRATGLGYSPPPALTEIENTLFRDSQQRAPLEHTLFKFLADRAAERTLTYREASANYSKDAWRYIVSNPGHTAWVWSKKAMYLINSWEVLDTASLAIIGQTVERCFPLFPGFGLIVILSVSGTVLTLCNQGRERAWLLLLCLPHVVTGIIFYVNGRLRAAMLPVLFLFAAVALRRLVKDLRSFDPTLWLWVPGILMMTALVTWEDDVLRRHRDVHDPAFLSAMEGLRALQSHDIKQAETAFLFATERDPFNAREAWANLATIRSRRGDTESAQKYERFAAGIWSAEELNAIRIPPFEEDRLSASLASAANAWREGRESWAANQFLGQLENHPGHPDILFNLAVYAATRVPPRCDHAIELIDEALLAGLKYEMVSTRARRLKARCLTQTGESARALAEMKRADWEEQLRPESVLIR